MRAPGAQTCRWGLIGGTRAITVLYVLMNLVYLRALPVEEMAEHGPHRRGRGHRCSSGPWGARIISAAVLVSTFGCISSTILYAARIYLPMAQDGAVLPVAGASCTRAT